MKFILSIGIFLFATQSQSFAITKEEMAGKAASCLACHGANGISTNSLWPNLAGQKKDYIEKQLQAFKKGERRDPLMNPIAENLSEQDIESLAYFFSMMK